MPVGLALHRHRQTTACHYLAGWLLHFPLPSLRSIRYPGLLQVPDGIGLGRLFPFDPLTAHSPLECIFGGLSARLVRGCSTHLNLPGLA